MLGPLDDIIDVTEACGVGKMQLETPRKQKALQNTKNCRGSNSALQSVRWQNSVVFGEQNTYLNIL
jgi:hypothetical protein